MAIIHLLVEGEIDEAVGRRIVDETGHVVGTCYGKQGYGYIQNKISGFNQSAINMTYLSLADFADTGFPCPGDVVSSLLPHRNAKMIFRIVVREIESWLLADREGMAGFLQRPIATLPLSPETEPDPKQTLVNLARNSRSRIIRTALVPNPGSTAVVGPLYNADLVRFVAETWDVGHARQIAPSLDRCVQRLQEVD